MEFFGQIAARAFSYIALLTTMLIPGLLQGCQSGGIIGAAGKVADVTMEVVGLKKPEKVPQPRFVPVRLHASNALNADSAGRGLSVIVKVYKLKDANNFLQTSYETFLNSGKDKDALGSDFLEVKEVLLVPGQQYASIEKLAPEVNFVGIVVLFREPNSRNWRLAIAQTDIAKTGLTLGVQSCAVKIIEGASANQASNTPLLCNK